MPYFISSVVVAGMVISFIDTDGLVMQLLSVFGVPKQNLRINSGAFPWIYTVTNVWKSFGYGTVVYMAAITSIDPSLYEAAAIDGAGRWQQTVHVTLPGMRMIIVLMMVLSLGNVLNAGFDQVYNLYNNFVLNTGDVLSTYIYRISLGGGGEFELSTAANLLLNVMGLIALVVTNRFVKKLDVMGIF